MNMDMVELIDMYRTKLDSDPYSCLLFALQLPSICSRIEYPPESLSENECNIYYYCPKNNRKEDGSCISYNPRDRALYEKWIMDHYNYFDSITKNIMTLDENDFGRALYEFRCCMTHEGVSVPLDLFTASNQYIRFCFVDVKTVPTVPFVLNNIAYVSVVAMCECLFDAAEFVVYDIKASVCDSVFLSFNDYNLILKNYLDQYNSFWNEYTLDERLLFFSYLQHYSKDDDESLWFKLFNVNRERMELIRKKYIEFNLTLELKSATINKICVDKKNT